MPVDLTNAPTRLHRRVAQLRRILAEEGPRPLGARMLTGAARRLDRGSMDLEVRAEDVKASDLSAPPRFAVPPIPPDGRLRINWVTTPPSRGSGGHTTMFRLIRSLEEAGHSCRVYLYDVYGRHASDHVDTLRAAFPEVRAEVGDVRDGMADAHAVFATAWMTAYPVFLDPCAGHRFYLVQDYEPWFYPVGGTAALVENTYRMGFHGVTAGSFLAGMLERDFGMTADWFEFGCDTAIYHLENTGDRPGICFYAKPNTPRRAYDLGVLALQLFAERHPGVEIHLFGDPVGDLGPGYVDHGRVTPAELNAIYNRCRAALSLSMTNVSLVPHEMLAAGCIPVVNDAAHNRQVLANDHVAYAKATPHDLARALDHAVTRPDFAEASLAASRSVSTLSWANAGEGLDEAIRRKLGGR